MVPRTDELGSRRGLLVCVCFVVAGVSGCNSASQSITGPSAAKCSLTASADTAAFPPSGGAGQISISTNRECPWTASASSGWIQLNGTTTGQGEARVSFTVGANSDPSVRQGTIRVADQQVAITQQAAPCAFTLDPVQASVPPAGGRGTIQVKASSALCTWTARSEAPWLTVVAGGEGTGNGQVIFEALATTGPPRNGTLTIAGQSVTVAQGDGCATSLSPAAHTAAAAGGEAVVSVTAGEGCAWAASSAAPWIAIASGTSGSGAGEVRLAIAANAGPQRTGTLTIGGHAFTVTQASGCTFTTTPSSQAFPADGGSGSFAVAAGAGCTWTATSGASWIAVMSGANGSGPGEVRFTVASSTGPARSATVNVGGQAFSVTQASGCRVAIEPASQVMAASGGSGTVKVSVGAGCPWTASASAPWVQIANGASGTGPGGVTFTAAAHDGPERQATLTIGGQLFTIRQESGCTFTLSAPGIVFGPTGGGGTVVVQTADGCSWNASTEQPWIQISAGHAGTGTGPVHFVVAPNLGPERAGTIVAGGQTFAIRQTGVLE